MRIEQRSVTAPERVLITGDTHLKSTRADLPEVLLEAADRCDLIIHTGDLCTMQALRLFESHGPVLAISGNNEELSLLKLLPDAIELRLADRHCIITHGHLEPGTSARTSVRRAYAGGHDLVIYGHSHMPEWEEVKGTWFLNPGSPTQRRRAPAKTFAELRIDGNPQLQVEFFVVY